MKKKTMIVTLTFLFVSLFIFAPISSLAATRLAELRNFVINQQDDVSTNYGGFWDSDHSVDTSIIATRSAAVIAEDLNFLGKITESEAETYLISLILNELGSLSKIDIAYILEGLDSFDAIADINSEDKENIVSFLNDSIETYDINDDDLEEKGFTLESGKNATIYGTYYSVKCYYHLDLVDINLLSIIDDIARYVLSCLVDVSSTQKGFRSNATDGEASLANTYFALMTLYYIERTALATQYLTEIVNFIKSFYIDDQTKKNHYGGYSFYPDDTNPYSSLLATYYATTSLFLLDSDEKPTQTTVNWVLSRQNPEDGGFCEIPISSEAEKKSSLLSSYYAVQILSINGFGPLNNEAWGYTLDWGLILGITIPIIALIIAGIVYYRKKTEL